VFRQQSQLHLGLLTLKSFNWVLVYCLLSF